MNHIRGRDQTLDAFANPCSFLGRSVLSIGFDHDRGVPGTQTFTPLLDQCTRRCNTENGGPCMNGSSDPRWERKSKCFAGGCCRCQGDMLLFEGMLHGHGLVLI